MHFKSIVMDDPSQRISLPRLGKIRLGVVVKARNGKEHPKEVSHFVVPPEVAEEYGPEPTVLDVLFPSLPLEEFFPQRLAAYGTNQKLRCEGNGKVARRRNEAREWEERTCPCEWLKDNRCSKQGLLYVILPKVNFGGLYQLDTGSSTSMSNLNSTIRYLISMVGVHNLSRVPVRLRRQETLIEDLEGRAQKHWPLFADIQLPPDALKNLLPAPPEGYSPPMLPEFIEEGPLVDTPIVVEDEEATQNAKGKLDAMAEKLEQKAKESAIDVTSEGDASEPEPKKEEQVQPSPNPKAKLERQQTARLF